MGAGERKDAEERGLNRLLPQALRKGLQPGGAACPGPEILAAYYERSLATEETSACELHLSRCLHCQQVLATLAASEPVKTSGRETALVRRYLTWRWLAPAAAAAAAVALWVAIRPAPLGREGPTAQESDRLAAVAPQAKPPVQDSDVARSIAPASAPPEAEIKREMPARGRQAQPAEKPRTSGVDEEYRVAGVRSVPSEVGKRADSIAGRATAAPPGPLAGAAANVAAPREKDKLDQKLAAQPSPAGQVAADTAEAPAASKLAEVKPEAGTAAYSAARAEQPVREATEFSTQKPVDAPPDARKSKVQVGLMLRQASLPGLRVITSPNLATLWRMGPGGKIERSRDSGRTWQGQQSGVTVDLLAGSAPSETVCWVAGRAGTILRATDGEHWEKVASPTRADVLGIEARDALHATIVASDGSKYTTEDAGRTWRQHSSSKQFPPLEPLET